MLITTHKDTKAGTLCTTLVLKDRMDVVMHADQFYAALDTLEDDNSDSLVALTISVTRTAK